MACIHRERTGASCVLFFSHNRAYYILAGNHPNGKPLGLRMPLSMRLSKIMQGKIYYSILKEVIKAA